MKIINSLRKIPGGIKKSAITMGVFDGVHLGHARLIESIKKWAKKNKGQSIIITFKQHPDTYLMKTKDLKFIKNLGDRIKILGKYKADFIVVLDFKKVAGIEAGKFIKEVLVKKFKMKYITVGTDFIFGRQGKGDVKFLKKMSIKYGFKVNLIKDVRINNEKVSSQAIRHYLKKGDIKTAERMLGHKYEIEGKVIHGRHIGYKLGFPTANIKIEYEEIPARGVWATLVNYGGKSFPGAANIGFAPTLKREIKPTIEVFIMGLHKKIYGRRIKIRFLCRIRDEKKFESRDALVKQVRRDISFIRENFNGEKWK